MGGRGGGSLRATSREPEGKVEGLRIDPDSVGFDLNSPRANLEAIKLQGFTELPTVLSPEDFDQQTKGQEILYRGISSDDLEALNKADNDLKYGDMKVPIGTNNIFGSGIYFGNKISVGERYSSTSREGILYQAALKKGTKLYEIDANKFKMVKNRNAFISRIILQGYDGIRAKGADIFEKDSDYISIFNRSAIILRGR